MLLETTFNRSGSSERPTHIPRNWYVHLKFSFTSRALIACQGEFAHRIVKRLFALTNKKDAVTQIATKYRREARSSEAKTSRANCQLDVEELEVVAPELHHHISHSRNSPLKIRNFLRHNPEDPAKKVSFLYCGTRINPNYRLERTFSQNFVNIFLRGC